MLEFAVVATRCHPYLLRLLALIVIKQCVIFWWWRETSAVNMVAEATLDCRCAADFLSCLRQLCNLSQWNCVCSCIAHLCQGSLLKNWPRWCNTSFSTVRCKVNCVTLWRSWDSTGTVVEPQKIYGVFISHLQWKQVWKTTSQVLTKHCLPKTCHVQMGHYVSNNHFVPVKVGLKTLLC